jgi:uncharacterized protein
MSKKAKRAREAKPSKELQAIWDKVPEMEDCQGKCQSSCGPIPVYTPERKLIEGRTGRETTCSMLTAAGVCSVYGIRPLICRIWGTVEDHPDARCPHGCKPKRWLTNEEAMALFAEVEALTGDGDGAKALRDMGRRMDPATRAAVELKSGKRFHV